jgi:Ca-activated chloride channel family protein
MVVKLAFTNQYANLIILINGLIILFFLASRKKNRQRAMKFGNYETLEKVAGNSFIKSSNIKLLIRLLAVTVLLVGISSPVVIESVPTSESDYVIAMDSSASMLSSDIEPSRFRAAKEVSRKFVARTGQETKIGLTSFSGEVKKELDLSTIKEKVRDKIKEIETGKKAGTAIGDALQTSSSMLLGSNRSKSVILITDGRNNVGSSINSSAEFASRNNVTIHTLGIGSRKDVEDESRVIDGQNASSTAFPNLDQSSLSKLANKTGGEFKTVSNRSGLETAFISIDSKKKETPVGNYMIIIGALLLLLEWMLSVTSYKVIP